MSTNRHKYIHDLAKTLQGQLKATPAYHSPGDDLARRISKRHFGDVLRIIGPWSDETKGKIAACGISRNWQKSGSNVTTIEEVLEGSLGDTTEGGQILLMKLAAVAILAAITDNIKAFYRHNPGPIIVVVAEN